ncbi:MAG: TlyA family rRNA (cytidine-2'-O)-methyltransferase [Deltaproteobacteria bacterium]|nr:TlyA family rRNA (cytidine-2'-O)-methyltransferase [Deltaproteobacteria bacterium]
MASRARIDQLLVERGLAASRDRARRLILAGKVLVNDCVVDKAGALVDVQATIRLKVPDHPYVGRGGLKLEGALDDFRLDVAGLRCLDVGASTGGFTDCLLQRGAEHVVATDVGSNQLAWKLRQDPRVTCHEQTDARSLTLELVGDPVDLCVVDVSFISLRLILPSVRPLLAEGAPILALVKPQFEVGREHVGKGGRVQDDALRQAAVDGVVAEAVQLGFEETGRHDSRLEGAKSGNREVFLLVCPRRGC